MALRFEFEDFVGSSAISLLLLTVDDDDTTWYEDRRRLWYGWEEEKGQHGDIRSDTIRSKGDNIISSVMFRVSGGARALGGLRNAYKWRHWMLVPAVYEVWISNINRLYTYSFFNRQSGKCFDGCNWYYVVHWYVVHVNYDFAIAVWTNYAEVRPPLLWTYTTFFIFSLSTMWTLCHLLICFLIPNLLLWYLIMYVDIKEQKNDNH